MKRLFFLLILLSSIQLARAQAPTLKIGLLKYKGGGDWYGDPTALPNLMRFCNEHLHTNFAADSYNFV